MSKKALSFLSCLGFLSYYRFFLLIVWCLKLLFNALLVFDIPEVVISVCLFLLQRFLHSLGVIRINLSFWAFRNTVLSSSSSFLRPMATAWSICLNYEVQRQSGVMIKKWICYWCCLSYILLHYTCAHTYFHIVVPSQTIHTRVISPPLTL